MDYYDEWFGLEYPLPKQGELQKKRDTARNTSIFQSFLLNVRPDRYPRLWRRRHGELGAHHLQGDLAAVQGIMDNGNKSLGLLRIFVCLFSFKEGETSVDAKQWVAIVVAHELAHQWFGNLVRSWSAFESNISQLLPLNYFR